MIEPIGLPPSFPHHVCQRAIDARDARFDGLLYVGIVTTRIYCRPTCPSRRANPDHRRFFSSAAAAEHAGFRPCLRCRPELAPGRTPIAAVSRLASMLAKRLLAETALSVTDVAFASGFESLRRFNVVFRETYGMSPRALRGCLTPAARAGGRGDGPGGAAP